MALFPAAATLPAATWASGTTSSTKHSPLGLSHLAAHFLANRHTPPSPLPAASAAPRVFFPLPLLLVVSLLPVCCFVASPLPPSLSGVCFVCCMLMAKASGAWQQVVFNSVCGSPVFDSLVSKRLFSHPVFHAARRGGGCRTEGGEGRRTPGCCRTVLGLGLQASPCTGETQLLRLTWLSQGRPVNTLGCATDSQPRKGDLWKWKLFMPVIIHLLYTYTAVISFLYIFVRFCMYVCGSCTMSFCKEKEKCQKKKSEREKVW